MIAHLNGVLADKSPGQVVLDVNGVGYALSVPLGTYESLGDSGSEIRLLTYLHVREDILHLYGFAHADERQMFMSLITVSGVGPKLALAILSGVTADSLRMLIVNEDVASLTRLPGLGKKTAQRLITELRDKFADLGSPGVSQTGHRAVTAEDTKYNEAILALTALGVTRIHAQEKVMSQLKRDPDLGVDELVRRILQEQ